MSANVTYANLSFGLHPKSAGLAGVVELSTKDNAPITDITITPAKPLAGVYSTEQGKGWDWDKAAHHIKHIEKGNKLNDYGDRPWLATFSPDDANQRALSSFGVLVGVKYADGGEETFVLKPAIKG